MSKKSLPTLPRGCYQDEQQDASAHPPSLGWFGLVKPARMSRKPKRSWKRTSGGNILSELIGFVALAMVVAVLLVGAL